MNSITRSRVSVPRTRSARTVLKACLHKGLMIDLEHQRQCLHHILHHKKSKQFNQIAIASTIAILTLTLSVNVCFYYSI